MGKLWTEKEHESITAARHTIDLADDYQERIETNLALISFFKHYNEYGNPKIKRRHKVQTLFNFKFHDDDDLKIMPQDIIDEMCRQAEQRIAEYRQKLLELKV